MDTVLLVIFLFIIVIAFIAVGFGIKDTFKEYTGFQGFTINNHLTHKSDSDDTLFVK